MFDIGFWADKGKPGENRGRKATGSKSFGYDSPAAEDWRFFYLRLSPDSQGEIDGEKYQTQDAHKIIMPRLKQADRTTFTPYLHNVAG